MRPKLDGALKRLKENKEEAGHALKHWPIIKSSLEEKGATPEQITAEMEKLSRIVNEKTPTKDTLLYEYYRNKARKELKQSAERNPGYFGLGQALGIGTTSTGAIAATGAASLPALLSIGAAEGGISGFGRSEAEHPVGTVADMVQGAGYGALGALAGERVISPAIKGILATINPKSYVRGAAKVSGASKADVDQALSNKHALDDTDDFNIMEELVRVENVLIARASLAEREASFALQPQAGGKVIDQFKISKELKRFFRQSDLESYIPGKGKEQVDVGRFEADKAILDEIGSFEKDIAMYADGGIPSAKLRRLIRKHRKIAKTDQAKRAMDFITENVLKKENPAYKKAMETNKYKETMRLLTSMKKGSTAGGLGMEETVEKGAEIGQQTMGILDRTVKKPQRNPRQAALLDKLRRSTGSDIKEMVEGKNLAEKLAKKKKTKALPGIRSTGAGLVGAALGYSDASVPLMAASAGLAAGSAGLNFLGSRYGQPLAKKAMQSYAKSPRRELYDAMDMYIKKGADAVGTGLGVGTGAVIDRNNDDWLQRQMPTLP